MAQKWIINRNELIVGNVFYHEELLGSKRTRKETIGGGLWWIDEEKKITYFYGASTDFGSVTEEQFQVAINNTYFLSHHISEGTIYFSQEGKFENVLKQIESGDINPIIITETIIQVEDDINVPEKYIITNHRKDFMQEHRPKSSPQINEKPKLGRNEQCHCGSGEKYKKCCINK